MGNYTENEKDVDDSLKGDVKFNLNRLNTVAKNLNRRIYETNCYVEDLEMDITKRLDDIEESIERKWIILQIHLSLIFGFLGVIVYKLITKS